MEDAADLTIRPARAEERRLLRELLDDYLLELSRYGEVDRRYAWFDAYWQPAEARWAYLAEAGNGRPVGFALVNTHAPSGEPADFSMAEFYIVPAVRRSGIGRESARSVFSRHPGTWELSAMHGNAGALRFWRSAIAGAGAGDLRVSEREGATIFRFHVP